MGQRIVHDFAASLSLSHQQAGAPMWERVYREAFPDMVAMASIRNDGWAQRGGIDRVITLSSGRSILVDEKVRSRVYTDILLEYWSDVGRRRRGWVAQDLACDFIAYAFIPSKECYLLPFQTLRRAWRSQHRLWVDSFEKVRAQNRGYVTVSVKVPIPVLLLALKDAMCIRWT